MKSSDSLSPALPAPRPPRSGAGPEWESAPCPVLVLDPAGAVSAVNSAASSLLPGAAPGRAVRDVAPSWLTEAHDGLDPRQATAGDPAVASGTIGERSFQARPVRRGQDVVWWLMEETGRRSAEEALAQERERAAFLSQASTALLSSLNAERCVEVTATLAARHLGDAAVFVSPPAGHRLPLALAGGDGSFTTRAVEADPAEVPGLAEALQGFPPVPSRWIDPAAVPDWIVPEGFEGPLGSVMVTPLPGHGVPAGALIVLRRCGRSSFTATEEVFAQLFAARAGAAISAARLYAEQAGITRTLMRELLPPALHRIDGVEFAGGYRPSGQSERVGGDFYDVHPATEDGEEAMAVLGDVCGKGLEAAVLTGKIRNTLHALLPLADDHARVLRLLNGALLTADHARFATLVLASVTRAAGTVRLRLTSAGHPVPLIVRDGGRVDEADTRGTLIGALPEVTVTTDTVELAPGETCLLYTDGITEARGGPLGDEMFGEERLRQALGDCAGLPAEAVVEHVQMLASAWVGDGPHDDMALVAITAPRHAHLSAVDGRTRGRYTA
ncbi:PP2C family protein-serine/threonine phosphatase [Streptomyces sp. NPDC007088]|uniref:PP2C family protein-serine/threonine phosphatase n=1 Tax=Streptomyces sp. NPDC007088 TaxID=3364773 RepID=UPI0036901AB8